jgi:hypothetical protein
LRCDELARRTKRVRLRSPILARLTFGLFSAACQDILFIEKPSYADCPEQCRRVRSLDSLQRTADVRHIRQTSHASHLAFLTSLPRIFYLPKKATCFVVSIAEGKLE